MSERYPKVWRDACLEFLKARRKELHQSLGYKRMSWQPVRNNVMRPYEYDGKDYKYDERLIRQNFDS